MFKNRRQLVQILVALILFSAGSVCAQGLDDEYRLAAGYYSRAQWDESASAFQSVIRRYPATDKAIISHFFLGESLMQVKNFGEAYKAYQVYLQQRPGHKFAQRATFRMGEAAFRAGNHGSALRLLESFVRANPDDSLNEFALAYLGEIRLKRHEPQLAQRAYETALRMFPQSPLSGKCRLGLAKAFQMQGVTSEAERFFRFLSERSKDDSLVLEADLQLGIIRFGEGQFDDARRHFAKALDAADFDQSKTEVAYWLARTHVKNQDYESAFAVLESVDMTEQTPEELACAVYFDGAVAATKIGKNEIADDWLERLRRQFPKHELGDDALYLQINLCQQSGDSGRADLLVRSFQREYPASPWKPGVLEAAGRSYYAKQEYVRSVEIFKQLLEEDLHVRPEGREADRANWHYLQGLGHLGLKQFEQAESSLASLGELEDSGTLKPMIQIARATARFGQQKFEASIPNFREYLRLAPDGSEAFRARADLTVALAETGRWLEVVGAFEDLRNHHADQGMVLETAAYLADKAIRENQTELAVRWFEMMAEPGNPQEMVSRALSELAWIKLESNRTAVAMSLFDRLLKECPDSKFAAEAAMAKAKFLDDKDDFERSSEMYGFVIRRFGSTDLANVARLRRAHAMQKMGGRMELLEAKTLLIEYLQLPSDQPNKDEALYRLAWVYFDLGLTDDGWDQLQQLMMRFPNSKYWPDAVYRVAKYMMQQERLADAKTLIDSLLVREAIPLEVLSRGLYLKGQLLAKQNDWQSVSGTMQMLLQNANDPGLTAKANYWLAESLYRQKKYQAACPRFRSLKEDERWVEDKLQPWIWLRLAQCLGHAEQWAEAQELAEAGIERYFDFQSRYEFDFVRARGLEDAGRLTDSRVAYQTVIDSKLGGATETAAIAQWRIGETYFHQENYPAAIEAYYRVDSLFSYPAWRSAALLQAGKCQEHLGNWRHAMKLYTKLIETFPDSDYAVTARERLKRVTLFAQIQSETETR